MSIVPETLVSGEKESGVQFVMVMKNLSGTFQVKVAANTCIDVRIVEGVLLQMSMAFTRVVSPSMILWKNERRRPYGKKSRHDYWVEV